MTKKKKNRSDISKLQERVKELEENWKRAIADYQNLEKRVSTQRKKFAELANASLIDKLLSVIDDLERAAEHIEDHGLKMIIVKFHEVLESESVKQINAQGKKFDPETMDCVEMVKGPKNKVVNVQLKGYRLNNYIIRPAKVEVGKGKKG